MLCTACRKIFDSSLKRPHTNLQNSYVHHESALEIEVTGKAGCYICSTLWDRFTEDEKELIRNADDKAQSVSFLQRLKHVFEATWRGVHHSIFGRLFAPWTKQFFMPNDDCCYGWRANLDSGGVEFNFGTRMWKSIYFKLQPCSGQSFT
jgi:hypothetical protein